MYRIHILTLLSLLFASVSLALNGYNTQNVQNAPSKVLAPPESQTDQSVTLLWDKPENYAGLSGFIIYRDGKQVAISEKTNYTDTDLQPDKEYTYYVVAKYKNGELSSPSETIKVRTKKTGKIFNVREYGAKGDGNNKDTKAIQKAIDACTPGGTVWIPKGIYLSGALYLKSDMTLYIEKGGILKGTTTPEDYLPKIHNRFEGWEMDTYASLLNAGKLDHKGGYSIKNLSIRGEGTISGGGETLAENIVNLKNEDRRSRGRLILLMNAQNVNIQGLKIEESPAWTIHYIYSNNVTLHDLDINSDVSNGDGIDPDSSTDSYIFNCTFSTGDDCIAIKSGKNPEGYYFAKPTKNVWISNCNFVEGHSIAIGSEMSGGVSNVLVRDCVAGDLLLGMQIKGTRDRGGYVKDVVVQDCDLRKITVFTSVPYNNDGEAAPLLPVFKNFTFSNIDMTKANKEPFIFVQGYEDSPDDYTKNVLFKDITLPEESVVHIEYCDDVTFDRVVTEDNKNVLYNVRQSMNVLFN